MVDEPAKTPMTSPVLRAAQVYAMAVVCLAFGLVIGYLLRGSLSSVTPAQSAANAVSAPLSQNAMGAGKAHELDEMKQIADKRAAPLLEKLKSDPNNSALLAQIAAIYHTSHQFKEAAGYYGKAVQFDPKNVALRTKLASSLYRNDQIDEAIAQLNQALSYDPKDANALFDLGMIRLQGKQDGKGALAAWQQLLKTNPQLSAERKAMVEKLMADVMTTQANQQAAQTTRSDDGSKSKTH